MSGDRIKEAREKKKLSRAELANEVRALLGYGRATEPLHAAVEAQVGRLLAEGRLGEGSTGLTLRRSASEIGVDPKGLQDR